MCTITNFSVLKKELLGVGVASSARSLFVPTLTIRDKKIKTLIASEIM